MCILEQSESVISEHILICLPDTFRYGSVTNTVVCDGRGLVCIV